MISVPIREYPSRHGLNGDVIHVLDGDLELCHLPVLAYLTVIGECV